MSKTADPRVPVRFNDAAPSADSVMVYLLEGEGVAPPGAYTLRFALPATAHPIGCACCAARGPAALALATLFHARATGAAPFFNVVQVKTSPAGEAALREALATDVTARARFRAS